MAAVITDSNGKLVAAGIKQSQLKENVSFVKAEAIEWGLQIAKEVALSSLIIEIDCKEVAELVNNIKCSKTAIYWIISESQHHKRDFQTVNVQFVRRSCNAHSHALAKFALGKDTFAV